MREEKVLIKGIESNFKIEGEGKPLLILHGWGIGSSNSWRRLQKILAAQGYRVIVPDFPGFGKSAKPSEPWNLSDYAGWLSDFFDLLKIEKLPVIAHSFGGRVIIKFINENPDKIEKLILCSPAGIKAKPDLETKIIFLLTKLGNIIFTAKYLRKFRESAKKLFYFFLKHKDYAKANNVMKETIQKILGEDLTLFLSNIDIKTLILWGQKDRIIPLKYAYIFREKIKNSRLEILPKSGHSPYLDNPEKLLEAIIKFLKS